MIEMEEKEETVVENESVWEGTGIRIDKDGSVEKLWRSEGETKWEKKESEN